MRFRRNFHPIRLWFSRVCIIESDKSVECTLSVKLVCFSYCSANSKLIIIEIITHVNSSSQTFLIFTWLKISSFVFNLYFYSKHTNRELWIDGLLSGSYLIILFGTSPDSCKSQFLSQFYFKFLFLFIFLFVYWRSLFLLLLSADIWIERDWINDVRCLLIKESGRDIHVSVTLFSF